VGKAGAAARVDASTSNGAPNAALSDPPRGPDETEHEEILEESPGTTDGTQQLLSKWKGTSHDTNTWEPGFSMNASKLCEAVTKLSHEVDQQEDRAALHSFLHYMWVTALKERLGAAKARELYERKPTDMHCIKG
jgi:hypothetical protein